MQDPLGVILSVTQGYSSAYTGSTQVPLYSARDSSLLEDKLKAQLQDNRSSASQHSAFNSVSTSSICSRIASVMEPSETDKRAIYKHPLFPLMALLFERCEQVTQSPDCPLVANLKSDIQAFVQHHQQHLADLESCLGKQPEVDSLMIKAIQILWIHLLELEKVNDLCKDFCTRYISCLRTKLQNEQLLHVDAFESDCSGSMMVDLPSCLSQSSDAAVYRRMSSGYDERQNVVPRELDRRVSGGGAGGGGGGIHGNHLQENSLYRMEEKGNDPPIMEQQRMQSLSMQDLGRPTAGIRDSSILMPQHSGNISPTLLASFASFDESDDDPRARMKKGILPKQATHVMKTWLFQHLVHPYPTEDEKRQLAEQTNLSILQVNNWFINARRRILQPIVDAGNQDGSKVKKSKSRCGQQLSPDISLGSGSVPGQRLPSCSESRSESSTPTSTTFEYDQNSLSEYQSRPQKDGSHDNSDEIPVSGHLKSSANFYGYQGGSYYSSGLSQSDPQYLPDARSGCADAMRSASNLDCDSYMGPNYSSDHESTSDGEVDEN